MAINRMVQMPTTALATVLDDLRRSLADQVDHQPTDARLLEGFLARHDEDAFAALLRRHGPMVLGVCRRLLHNEADAEDAFQATFLVFVRKAGSIRPRGMVGNWLYGVAHRTARKARAMHSKRLLRERKAAQSTTTLGSADNSEPLLNHLDRELQALPDIYRAAIVLCDLEGRSIRDAARLLGCPQGTVGTRLARGRRLLARRLAGRKAVLSGAMVASMMAQQTATAGVPMSLLQATIKAGLPSAAGLATAGVISAPVAALTEGVLKNMLLTRLKTAIVFTAALLALGAGAWQLLAFTTTAADQPPTAVTPVAKPQTDAAPLIAAQNTGDQPKSDDEPINHIWITQKNVQEELHLTENQVKKIQAIRLEVQAKFADELKKAQAEAKKQNFAAYKEVSRRIQDAERKAFAEEAPKLLSAGAIKRLQQIQRQARGLHNLIREPAIRKKLNLDDEQLKKIEEFLKEGAENAKKESAKQQPGPILLPLTLEDSIALGQKAYAGAMKKAVGVLTKDQQRIWDELVGEPFAFKAAAPK